MVTLFGNQISWKSNLQSVVAFSTTEVEYIAYSEAVKEALWIKGLVERIRLCKNVVKVYCDNQNSIYLTKNPMVYERTY